MRWQTTYTHTPTRAQKYGYVSNMEDSRIVNPEGLLYPHSALNLITKTKVSPGIYRFQQTPVARNRPQTSSGRSPGAYRQFSGEVAKQEPAKEG
jgi:hypothetical protein